MKRRALLSFAVDMCDTVILFHAMKVTALRETCPVGFRLQLNRARGRSSTLEKTASGSVAMVHGCCVLIEPGHLTELPRTFLQN